MTRLYFAYGSNMSSARLIERVGGVSIVGLAQLRGYEHRFNKLGNDGTAKGNVEVLGSGVVWGVAYRLTSSQVERLTEIESGYEPFEPAIEVGGSRLEAISFRAVIVSDAVVPRPEYIEHYRVGAREHGVPADYLDAILALANSVS